ncbi:hypothetical protein J6590_067229 [Homalodisca vitripennis]|nr:hypothetical protein J6590_067229 [Homalodisca vitripennis]
MLLSTLHYLELISCQQEALNPDLKAPRSGSSQHHTACLKGPHLCEIHECKFSWPLESPTFGSPPGSERHIPLCSSSRTLIVFTPQKLLAF